MTPTPEERAREIAARLSWFSKSDAKTGERAIATAIREARNSALEEAAGVAKELDMLRVSDWSTDPPFGVGESVIAGAILALKDKP